MLPVVCSHDGRHAEGERTVRSQSTEGPSLASTSATVVAKQTLGREKTKYIRGRCGNGLFHFGRSRAPGTGRFCPFTARLTNSTHDRLFLSPNQIRFWQFHRPALTPSGARLYVCSRPDVDSVSKTHPRAPGIK